MKYFYSVIIWRIKQININMRCIEMNEVLHYTTDSDRININMRCIEINNQLRPDNYRLMININMRCIEIVWKTTA